MVEDVAHQVISVTFYVKYGIVRESHDFSFISSILLCFFIF